MHRLVHRAKQRVDEHRLRQQRDHHPPRIARRQDRPAAQYQQRHMRRRLLRARPVGALVETLQHIGRHDPHLAGALAGDDEFPR
jgi:hypothetical protein